MVWPSNCLFTRVLFCSRRQVSNPQQVSPDQHICPIVTHTHLFCCVAADIKMSILTEAGKQAGDMGEEGGGGFGADQLYLLMVLVHPTFPSDHSPHHPALNLFNLCHFSHRIRPPLTFPRLPPR